MRTCSSCGGKGIGGVSQFPGSVYIDCGVCMMCGGTGYMEDPDKTEEISKKLDRIIELLEKYDDES